MKFIVLSIVLASLEVFLLCCKLLSTLFRSLGEFLTGLS